MFINDTMGEGENHQVSKPTKEEYFHKDRDIFYPYILEINLLKNKVEELTSAGDKAIQSSCNLLMICGKYDEEGKELMKNDDFKNFGYACLQWGNAKQIDPKPWTDEND
jgi:hypothetical protein